MKADQLTKRCVITGASGFVGGHLRRRLEDEGHLVLAIRRDLLYFRKKLQTVIEAFEPTHIFHIAAYGNRHYQQEELKIVHANIDITMNLLEATRDIPYQAFINTGSSSEYGTKRRPMVETDSLDGLTFYAASKAAASLLCRAFAHKYGKPVVTARPFSLYGPGEQPDKFIPTLVRCVKQGQVLPLASGVHDWIHIDDYINGVLTIASEAQGLAGRSVNVGTGIQTSNHALVGLVRELTGLPVRIKPMDMLREYDTKECWVADTTLLRSLGWKPQMTLEEGLNQLIYGNKAN